MKFRDVGVEWGWARHRARGAEEMVELLTDAVSPFAEAGGGGGSRRRARDAGGAVC